MADSDSRDARAGGPAGGRSEPAVGQARARGGTGAQAPTAAAAGTRPEPRVKARGKAAKAKARPPRALALALRHPVARVAVDIPLAHLDRPFDYLVPDRMDKDARPGVRVRVRFAGQLVDGYVLARAAASEHPGRLAYLERVVSPERVLTPEVAGLARAVADRYAGTLADVLRMAIPPRHAATEAIKVAGVAGAAGAGQPRCTRQPLPPRPAPGTWERYPAGQSFLAALAAGRDVRAAWSASPGPGWPGEIARAAATTASAGRGAVIVVPDARDLARVDDALAGVIGGTAHHVTLAADLGPAERYRRWLAVLRGDALIAAGTRAAMFAPVRDLGLVVLWDDGDDLHAEPHAPYPNAREVLATRAHRAGAAALIGGFARTAELTQLVRSGWARPLGPANARAAAPRIRAAADDAELARDAAAVTARLPSLALRTARAALGHGPVLVQVPRRGYLAAIACGWCRAPARCGRCGGPLQIGGVNEVPRCRWCGALAGGWSCPRCGHGRVRAVVTGAARTAEELGRAFPGVKVRTSGGRSVIAAVPDEPALVIATPGAEPLGRYAAALLLDGWALLSLPGLRAGEEALRRWLAAAALVRPASDGGTVLVHADASLPAVQALIRWDPVHFAERELAERAELHFPPAVRMASVTGAATAVGDFLEAELPASAVVLGPVPAEDGRGGRGGTGGGYPPVRGVTGGSPPGGEQVRALIRVPRAAGLALAQALHAAQAARSARKEPGVVRVQLDPAI